jgi:hypothetical protein
MAQLESELKDWSDAAKLANEMNDQLQRQVKELKQKRDNLIDQLEVFELKKEEELRDSRQQFETVRKEKDLLMSKYKKLQHAAAKVPIL